MCTQNKQKLNNFSYFAEDSNEVTSSFHLMKRAYNNRKNEMLHFQLTFDFIITFHLIGFTVF